MRMTEIADSLYPFGLYDNFLLFMIRAFNIVKVEDDSVWITQAKGFVLFNGPIGFNINGNRVFKDLCGHCSQNGCGRYAFLSWPWLRFILYRLLLRLYFTLKGRVCGEGDLQFVCIRDYVIRRI